MSYVTNRNHGCRLKEIFLKNSRALILENDRIHLLILLEKGADIIEFNHKRTDTEFMWRSPAGLDLMTQARTGRECYVGGWFETFPNGGPEYDWHSHPIPRYGDIRSMPWEFSVVKDEPEETIVRLFANSTALPLALERTMTLKAHEDTLHIDESVRNLSQEEIRFSWGHHPNIGAPFLNGDCIIDLPDCELYGIDVDEAGNEVERYRGKWPMVTVDGTPTDLSKVPQPDTEPANLFFLRNLAEGRASVRDTRTGIGIGFTWDASVFKNLVLWRAFGSDHWDPTFGRLYLLCFFIRSCHGNKLDVDDERIALAPQETLRTWLKAKILTDGGKAEGDGD